MSDHAATIREALGDPEICTPEDFADSVRAGLAALDALEADLAEARERGDVWHAHFTKLEADLAACKERLARVELASAMEREMLTARYQKAEAALAEADA